MNTPDTTRGVGEIRTWFYDRNPKTLTSDNKGLYFAESDVIEALTTLHQKHQAELEKAVEERDDEWRKSINYLIQNSEGSTDWFNALRACRSITPTKTDKQTEV